MRIADHDTKPITKWRNVKTVKIAAGDLFSKKEKFSFVRKNITRAGTLIMKH